MSSRSYRSAFFLASVVCLLLGAALVFVLLRGHPLSSDTPLEDPVVARGLSGPEQPLSAAKTADASAEPDLSPIQLSPQRMQEIGVTTAVAAIRQLNDRVSVPGTVDIDERRISYVQTRFAGWIQNVFANATYQYVRKGERLFTIYSPDIVSSEQEYLLARQNQNAFSQDGHGADGHGADQHGTARQESDWLLHASEDRLHQFGIPDQEITNLQQSGKVQHDIAINSPVSGYITERNALSNAYVQPETKLYTIADLSTVWVYANVAQSDVGRLRPGNAGQVTVDSYPGRKFNGRVDQVLPQVDPATRTVRVRLIFPNPGIALKPGMYVNVDLAAPLGRQLVVPASAVLQAGARTIAFVDHGGGNLEPRTVETGPTLDDSIVILKGLKAGDRVVSSANFLLDSEVQVQASMGAARPPTPPASPGQGAASAPQLQLDFITVPSPPRKGTNALRVFVKGGDGKPVPGAQVTVAFFMPAMPAMGMAAEHAQATLSDKGNGTYEAPLELPSGGTWQVTVTVQRGGQIIATKQLTASATGGM
ncbi:MAG TPA: FixH family protein [Terracidiphilus sp.]